MDSMGSWRGRIEIPHTAFGHFSTGRTNTTVIDTMSPTPEENRINASNLCSPV